TDKASMDVPSTAAGTITEVLLKRGDKVSQGSLIARVDTNSQAAATGSATTLSASHGPEDSERTVKQPVFAGSAPPGRAVSGDTAAQAAARGEPTPAAPPRAARPESAGDTVRMPQPRSTTPDRAGVEFKRSTQLLVLGAG